VTAEVWNFMHRHFFRIPKLISTIKNLEAISLIAMKYKYVYIKNIYISIYYLKLEVSLNCYIKSVLMNQFFVLIFKTKLLTIQIQKNIDLKHYYKLCWIYILMARHENNFMVLVWIVIITSPSFSFFTL
jgi:hypothetical protein